MPLMNDIYNGQYSDIWLKSKDISDFDAEGFYRRAFQKVNMGYLNEAIADLDKAIAGNANFAEAWSLRGMCKLDQNNFAAARADIDTALLLDSTLAMAWDASGSIKAQQGNTIGAEADFLRAYQFDPQYSLTLYNLGTLYISTNNFKLATHYLKKAIVADPDYAPARLQLALCYAYNNKPRKALHIINHVIKATPENKTAIYYRVACLLMLNKYKQAYTDLTQLLAIDSTNTQLIIELGKVELHLGKTSDGLFHLAKAVYIRNMFTGTDKIGNYYENELDDIILSTWLVHQAITGTQLETIGKAALLILEGNAPAAEALIYKKTKDVPPPALEMYVRLAIFAKSQYTGGKIKLTEVFQPQIADLLHYNPKLKYIHSLKAEENGNTDASIVYLSEALRADSQYVYAYNARGWLYMLRKRFYLAQIDFDNAIRIYPNYILAYKNRGDLFAAQGFDSLAIIDYKKVKLLNTNALEPYIDLASAFARLNKPDSAYYYINQGLAISPDVPEFIETRAALDMHFGKPDNAYNSYTQLIKLNPKNALYYYQRGNICFEANKLDSAAYDFKQSVIIDSGFTTGYLRLAQLYQYGKKDYQQAIAAYTQALKIDSTNIWALTDRGTLYVETNNIDSAEIDLSRAILSDSAHSVAFGNLGWVKYLKKQFPEAILYSDKAVKLDSSAVYAMYNKALATLCMGNTQLAIELYTQTALFDINHNNQIDQGAINDLQKLIASGVMVNEAEKIIKQILVRKNKE
jgi:tetratricopeptide (TPR) repeat protein